MKLRLDAEEVETAISRYVGSTLGESFEIVSIRLVRIAESDGKAYAEIEVEA